MLFLLFLPTQQGLVLLVCSLTIFNHYVKRCCIFRKRTVKDNIPCTWSRIWWVLWWFLSPWDAQSLHVNLDPQRAELHFLAENSSSLWHKDLSSPSATWGDRGSTLKREQKTSALSVFPTEACIEMHRKLPTLQRWAAAFWSGWSFPCLQAPGSGLSLLLSRQDALNVSITKSRTLPGKMAFILSMSQRWWKDGHCYRRVYHQKEFKSTPNLPTQVTSYGCGMEPPGRQQILQPLPHACQLFCTAGAQLQRLALHPWANSV